MKYLRFLVFGLFGLMMVMIACAREEDELLPTPQEEERFINPIFPLYNRYSGIPYGEGITQNGTTKYLKFDFFEPRDDPEERRPLIILAKGVGFIDVSKDDFNVLAELFVSFGYTVANLDYRIDDRQIFPIDTLTSYDNLIKAREDIRTAVRVLLAEANGANRFRINPDQVFLLGYSAGAIAALHAAYLNEGDHVSALVDSLVRQNGGWDDITGIRAMVNLAGGLIDADYISVGEPPLISVHGQMDEIVPVCDGQTSAGEFLEPFYIEGSCLLHQVALEKGVQSVFLAPENGRHDTPFSDAVCPDCLAAILIFLFEML